MTNYYELDGLPPNAKAAALKALAEDAARQAAEQGEYAPDPDISDDERAFTDFRREVASGAAPPPRSDDPPSPDGFYADVKADFEADIARGLTHNVAVAKAFSKVNYVAQAEDPRWRNVVDVNNPANKPTARYGELPPSERPTQGEFIQ